MNGFLVSLLRHPTEFRVVVRSGAQSHLIRRLDVKKRFSKSRSLASCVKQTPACRRALAVAGKETATAYSTDPERTTFMTVKNELFAQFDRHDDDSVGLDGSLDQ
jgi:hypothetical protein